MGDRRPRPRKSTTQPVAAEVDQELLEAALQEQAEANEAQRIHLGQRVAVLRKENNQLKKRVAELEAQLPKRPQDHKPPAKKTTPRKTTAKKTAAAAN